MDFRPTEEQDLLRRTVREFAETEIRPHVTEWDEAQHFPGELMPKLASLGLLGIPFPEHYGGAAMSAIDYCICIEELARVDPSVALSVAAHNGLCSSHIFLFGEQQWGGTVGTYSMPNSVLFGNAGNFHLGGGNYAYSDGRVEFRQYNQLVPKYAPYWTDYSALSPPDPWKWKP